MKVKFEDGPKMRSYFKNLSKNISTLNSETVMT